MSKRHPWILTAVLFTVLYGIGWGIQSFTNLYLQQIVLIFTVNAVLAISLNLIIGYTGLFSLGHAGFMAIGAYVAGAVTVYGAELPFLAALPDVVGDSVLLLLAALAGGSLSALAGILIGLPTLRLRGDYLAMATLGFGEIVRVIVLNVEAVGAARGFSTQIPLTSIGLNLILVALTFIVVLNITSSTKGKALLAIREDETAASSVGINITRFKVIAFAIGAFFAGVAGFAFAHINGYLHPNSFTFLRSFEIIVMVILGGMGSLSGSVLAAGILTALPELLRQLPAAWQFPELRMLLYAILLILMMMLRPQGLFGKAFAKAGAAQ